MFCVTTTKKSSELPSTRTPNLRSDSSHQNSPIFTVSKLYIPPRLGSSWTEKSVFLLPAEPTNSTPLKNISGLSLGTKNILNGSCWNIEPNQLRLLQELGRSRWLYFPILKSPRNFLLKTYNRFSSSWTICLCIRFGWLEIMSSYSLRAILLSLIKICMNAWVLPGIKISCLHIDNDISNVTWTRLARLIEILVLIPPDIFPLIPHLMLVLWWWCWRKYR